MFRSPIFYGVVTFVFSLILWGVFLPEVTCVDGWGSPSVGSRGACSHHGGVDSLPITLAIIFSFVSGLFVWLKLNKHRENLADPDNKIIKASESYSKSFWGALNIFLCKSWNLFVKILRFLGILKLVPPNGWVFASLIILFSILLPPLCFVLYPIGIAALLNGANPENDFLIVLE